MGEAQRSERAGFARQLLAVGRFTQRRMEQVYGEHDFWCVDDWEAIAAEIGAELGISRGRASSQMRYGTALLERFPKLGEVFLAGEVGFRVIAAAIFRTDLIIDKDVLAKIDAELAAKAPAWNKLSRERSPNLSTGWRSTLTPTRCALLVSATSTLTSRSNPARTAWPRSGAVCAPPMRRPSIRSSTNSRHGVPG
ncbi:MAG: hypothetical protein QOG75_6653 [Mycobacterium sp.]|jgi:hypothetical protein|nr:hypothetical protein [Mycobacterium sp.]